MAQIDLVEAKEAFLDPDPGQIFSAALSGLEAEVTDEPSTEEQDLLAEAVEALQRQGNRAPVYAKERAAACGDRHPEPAERWRKIGRLADDLLRRAARRKAAETGEE